MTGKKSKAARRWLSAGLLGLALVPFPWSCQRRPSAPVAAPPPNYFDIGESAFQAGDYARAIEAFRAYLRTTPAGPLADRVLFRMAMAYALPESSEHNAAQATQLLAELLQQHPHSVFSAPAEFLLRQQAELQQQQSEVERLLADLGSRESQIQNLSQELDQVRQVDQAELDRLRTEVSQREARIRQLSQELDRLKQIDLQRRPAAPLP